MKKNLLSTKMCIFILLSFISIKSAFGDVTPPKDGWIMKQKWSNLGFIHWSVDPKKVEKLIPKPLKLDTYEGKAYIGIVPFEMTTGRLAYVLLPLYRAFAQVNLRTYVTYNGKRGVYFFSLDADNFAGSLVADSLFGLPYRHSNVSISNLGNTFFFESENLGHELELFYKPTSEVKRYSKKSKEVWLTDLTRYFQVKNNCIFTSELWHPDFKIQEASSTILKNNLLKSLNLNLSSNHSETHFIKETITFFWPVEKIDCK